MPVWYDSRTPKPQEGATGLLMFLWPDGTMGGAYNILMPAWHDSRTAKPQEDATGLLICPGPN